MDGNPAGTVMVPETKEATALRNATYRVADRAFDVPHKVTWTGGGAVIPFIFDGVRLQLRVEIAPEGTGPFPYTFHPGMQTERDYWLVELTGYLPELSAAAAANIRADHDDRFWTWRAVRGGRSWMGFTNELQKRRDAAVRNAQ